MSGPRMLTLLNTPVWVDSQHHAVYIRHINVGILMEGTCSGWVYRGPEVLV